MRRRILTLGETDIYLHVGTILFGAYALLMGALPEMAIAFLSILLHECAHGAAAWLAGQPPQEMELTPMGAVLRMEDEERLPPVRRLLMLAAGPAMTLLLCVLSLRLTAGGVLPQETGRMLFTSNLAILLMNLLPALPLDGGRMLALALGCILRQETVRRILRLLGTALGLAAVGVSVWLSWRHGGWNWSLAAAGCFLLYSASAATTAQALAELRRLMDRKIVLEKRGYAPLRQVAILETQPLRRAIRLLAPRAVTAFTLLQMGTMACTGVLQESEVIAAWLECPHMNCREAAEMINRDKK